RRKPRGVELTEAGRAFLDKARAALANVDQAIVTARRTARGEQGRLCVGLVPTAPFRPFVPPVVRAFREAFPLVSLTLQEAFSHDLVERLRSEQLDAAFIRSPPADPSALLLNHLLDEALVAAISDRHPLARRSSRDAPVFLKELAGEPFVMLGGQSFVML